MAVVLQLLVLVFFTWNLTLVLVEGMRGGPVRRKLPATVSLTVHQTARGDHEQQAVQGSGMGVEPSGNEGSVLQVVEQAMRIWMAWGPP